jgi:2-oxoglutarate dehydrogenase E2 component (dihydrolipoamide succinyltransferase)
MKQEVKIPAMGESIAEVGIGSILKPSGTFVQEGEEIIELETEKVNQVLYAPATGQIHWKIEAGQTLSIGEIIGYIDTESRTAAEPLTQHVAPPSPPPPPQKEEAGLRISQEKFLKELKTERTEEKPQEKVEDRVSPVATKSSKEGETRKKMSKIRKTIAHRLVEAMHQTAMLTTFNEADMTQVIELRSRHKESFAAKYGVKLGFMSFFIKACVEGLKAFSDLNSYIDGEDIVQRNYYNIGIAVSTDKGLVVPVIRGCDDLSFSQIEEKIAEYAKKARDGHLAIEDLQGGGFTLTNGGVFGSLLSTPLLSPGQSGILGMHQIQKRAVIIQDAIEIRPMMYLALSYDHRIVDGKEAISFLIRVKEVIEDPSQLMFVED